MIPQRALAITSCVLLFMCQSAIRAAAGEICAKVITPQSDSDGGKVVCDLYVSAEGFPIHPEEAIAHVQASLSNHVAVCVFRNLRNGTYAIGAFHDENENGKLDSNFIGFPSEPVGVSNDAKGTFGPPSFDDAAFVVSGNRVNITFHVN